MVKAGNIVGFAASYEAPGLFVRAVISKITTGGLVFDSNINMAGALSGDYFGHHTPPAGQEFAYLVEIHAYTDGTYSTINNSYPGIVLSYQSVILQGDASPANLTGYLEPEQEIIGYVSE